MGLTIQVDSREKARAIKKILSEFEKENVKYYISKLWAGDYMSLDNPRVIIDRKQNLSEICGNVCQNHNRFKNELMRAQEHGIKLIILVEHSNQIKCIEDVANWNNPRCKKTNIWVDDKCVIDKSGEEYWEVGHYVMVDNKAMTGKTLSKIMKTMEQKYGCQFHFCDKLHTGKKIIELLGSEHFDK
jgi:ERCC4-type nuclease